MWKWIRETWLTTNTLRTASSRSIGKSTFDRLGMYIGKLGDGSSEDDGIYVLLKEVLDNCIDEFVIFGKQIEVECDGQVVTAKDFIEEWSLKTPDCSSKINTGAKYDSAFKKSVGLNGVGIKAANALSTKLEIRIP